MNAEGKLNFIDTDSIKRICSGQVVVDLSTAVKELVENSLDAGATSIEIRFKEMGASSIEISDNGSGIQEENFESVALKHFTSKIRDFEDLGGLTSFGFRGEALNALCELSKRLTITTKHLDSSIGTALAFNRNGSLSSRVPAARSVGTTIILEELFDALPVRRGEFVRSIKKQYQKMVKCLQSYAIISTGVRIVVMNGGSIVFATQSSRRNDDLISSVFGSKFMASLTPVNIDFLAEQKKKSVSAEDAVAHNDMIVSPEKVGVSDMEKDVCEGSDTTSEQRSPEDASAELVPSSATTPIVPSYQINGFVSKSGLGVGRSDNDRQFVYCNKRPVDMPKMTKMLNEVWRKYEMKQKPAFIVDITVPSSCIDVNLAPNKREIALLREDELIECMKDEVDKLYAPSRYTFALGQGVGDENLKQTDLFGFAGFSNDVSAKGQKEGIKSTIRDKADESNTEIDTIATDVMGEGDLPLSAPIEKYSPEVDQNIPEEIAEIMPSPPVHRSPSPSQLSSDHSTSPFSERIIRRPFASTSRSDDETKEYSGKVVWATEIQKQTMLSPDGRSRSTPVDLASPLPVEAAKHEADDVRDNKAAQESRRVKTLRHQPPQVAAPVSRKRTWNVSEEEVIRTCKKDSHTGSELSTDALLHVRKRIRSSNGEQRGISGADDDSNPTSTTNVSLSLSNEGLDLSIPRVLKKTDFLKMRVIGQFNLGFIVAQLNDDLYILDQHACDEKYLFETLQQSTVIHQQPLIHPYTIEASPAEESTIKDNVEVFEANGFKLRIDESAPPGERVKLMAVPLSKNQLFGSDDIHELASMLADYDVDDGAAAAYAPSKLILKNDALTQQSQVTKDEEPRLLTNNMAETQTMGGVDSGDAHAARGGGKAQANLRNAIRLPKLLSMFASRACRSAVMIGTALSHQEMKGIVGKLSGIEQPWNCPHGRPTMRHLHVLEKDKA